MSGFHPDSPVIVSVWFKKTQKIPYMQNVQYFLFLGQKAGRDIFPLPCVAGEEVGCPWGHLNFPQPPLLLGQILPVPLLHMGEAAQEIWPEGEAPRAGALRHVGQAAGKEAAASSQAQEADSKTAFARSRMRGEGREGRDPFPEGEGREAPDPLPCMGHLLELRGNHHRANSSPSPPPFPE